MARIEEVDDVPTASSTASLPPSAETPFPIRPKSKTEDASTVPSLPPAMDSVRSHTADEIVQMMKRTPLFMTDLEDSVDDQEENVELEALKALQYEGTRSEVALGFKERGNEMVAEKRWKDAQEFYTKGIAALKAPAQPEESTSEEQKRKERGNERKVEEACYVNRALCNLELSTYTLLLPPSLDTSPPI
ncbi:MAG: hypothetical protein Q9218_005283 [Villophora microphyllina]